MTIDTTKAHFWAPFLCIYMIIKLEGQELLVVFIAYELLPQTFYWLMLVTEFQSISFVGSILNTTKMVLVCSERIRLLREKCMLLIVATNHFAE